MEFHLAGKTVLISAGSMGIGRAAAEEFIKEGCKVALCSSNEKNLIKTVAEIKKTLNVEPVWSVCDINNLNDIENTVKVVNNNFGEVDILVNNCGGPKPGYFEDLNDKDWQDALDQVLLSAVRFTRLVLPGMIKKGWGRMKRKGFSDRL